MQDGGEVKDQTEAARPSVEAPRSGSQLHEGKEELDGRVDVLQIANAVGPVFPDTLGAPVRKKERRNHNGKIDFVERFLDLVHSLVVVQRQQSQRPTQKHQRVQPVLRPDAVAAPDAPFRYSKHQRRRRQRPVQQQRRQRQFGVRRKAHVGSARPGKPPPVRNQTRDAQEFVHVPRIFLGDQLLPPRLEDR